MFWGEEQVTELHNLIFGPPKSPFDPNSKTLINRLYNVVTMSADAHAQWSNGYFVLEPHPDDDPAELHSQRAVLYWIYPHESSRLSPGVFSPIELVADSPPLSSHMSDDNRRVALYYFDEVTQQPRNVENGHIIKFGTDDPISSPLPSRELLWLQSCLIRVLRMAGRAGWDMREMNESGSDIDSIGANDGLEREPDRGPSVSGGNQPIPPQSGTLPAIIRTSSAQQHSALPPATVQTTAEIKPPLLHRTVGRVKRWIRIQSGKAI